ncbi:MAG: hypothetical protein EBU90_24920, partial [Proteobacteria bacterium]|nr:hypothetical protein [Pseudomonadota bacterium]
KKGAAANPNGRPKGQSRTTCIRQAIKNIFENEKNESLEDYLANIKKNEPVEFMKVMAKLAPKELDIKGDLKLTEIRRVIIDNDNT